MVENLFSRRIVFWIVFLGVGFTLVGASFWVILFVRDRATVEDETAMANAESLIYVDYTPNADDYISAESYLAMGDYDRRFDETQNVQVLGDLTVTEITGYMINHFSSGLGVDCSYCHSLENFAADEWDDEVAMANKTNAREHIMLTRDLNQEWLTQLPGLSDQKRPSGAQITCATCHLGEPQFETWPTGQTSLPDDLRLPTTPLSVEEQDILNVNARRDISLDTVQYNQNVMYHMNVSMGVGCTHCHNSRYFPSWEVPAKYYSLNMLQMSQFILEEYGESLGGQEPSCLMCHREAVIPPGSAISAELLPDAITAAR